MEQAPRMRWTRKTTWRQGHVLGANAAATLGLAHAQSPDETCIMVVTHDCDLANDNLSAEPQVEVIVGRLLIQADGNFTWAKAPRTLHLELSRNGKPVIVELVATGKRLVDKEDLAPFSHNDSFDLDPAARAVLRSWLAVRYNRAAFPDAFVDRMGQTKLGSRLAKLLEPHGSVVSAVYFLVDDGKEIGRADGSPYELSIVLAHPPGEDPEAIAEVAEHIEIKVEGLFINKCYDGVAGVWRNFWLRGCVAISEDDLPVSRAKQLTQWRLEHMSLREDGKQPMPFGA